LSYGYFQLQKLSNSAHDFLHKFSHFLKIEDVVTWRIKLTKNRLAILSKFLITKNSLFGLNSQQKIFLKNLRDISPKIKEESIKNIFAILA